MNPISGTSNKAGIPELIANTLDTSLFDYEIKYTEHAGHAFELASEAKNEGADIVAAIGGDGTVNEVARAITKDNDNNVIVDILPLTLEEIFIYEMGGVDYEVKDILF